MGIMKGTNIVLLDPDVAEVFPDSRAVNEALRVLARVAKRQAKRKPKKTAYQGHGADGAEYAPRLMSRSLSRRPGGVVSGNSVILAARNRNLWKQKKQSERSLIGCPTIAAWRMFSITSTLSKRLLKVGPIRKLAVQCHTKKSPKRCGGNGSSTQESSLDETRAFHARRGRRLCRAGFLDGRTAVIGSALDSAESLSMFGERGRIVPELQQPNVRELLIQRYRLIYEVFDAKVEILAFIHGARDFAKWRQSATGEAG